ncbi:SRPBCC family protein [Saccharolobus solfataricus]|uniref:Polyketide cyclase n=2 Tax=Saccharolobus solfataricus TaxID=2287 RepID=Q7LXG7_SACS2|nr:SRPBCC family protein [Saccharolobus solfataricus]AAK41106.1 Hypothetical protein SSO0807 [Saccharolobus solfataricus P2]QPG49199.1 SRPBCC family protein [Saccharolobus solfataricus]CAB57497.1 hypothetical protein [Saccharolobus solfataricus P2]SAI84404.1 polyketide cyclase [Saccharolobus solfataricus]
MEKAYDFEVEAPPEVVRDYLMNPENLMKYIPHFKDLKRVDDGWELYVSWLFTIKLKVKRVFTNTDIIYLVEKSEGLIKIKSSLRFTIFPSKGGITIVRLVFFYDGPFESIVKGQADAFYRKGKEVFKTEMTKEKRIQEEQNGVKGEVSIYEMKTIFSGKINKDELEKYLEIAMVKSVNSTVVVILSDERNIIEIKFKGGELVAQKGDLDSLSSPITILIKQ